jgi:hypothetical protein
LFTTSQSSLNLTEGATPPIIKHKYFEICHVQV